MPHTPAPWSWRKFGTELMLVGEHGPRPVVLCASMDVGGGWDAPGRIFLATRDPKTGVLVELTPEHPDARLIAAAPELLDELKLALWYLENPGSQPPLAVLERLRKAIAEHQ